MNQIKLKQAKLPYADDAFEPVISKETISYHYYKHHAAYTRKSGAFLEKLSDSREEGNFANVKADYKSLSFNLNGHLLHELYWRCMSEPKDGNLPTGEMMDRIESSFGSFNTFKAEFTAVAAAVEGSGWAVLQDSGDDLIISQVEKHNLLSIIGYKPVLCVDVWEHAYYVDYKNDRGAYLDAWWRLVDWDRVLVN